MRMNKERRDEGKEQRRETTRREEEKEIKEEEEEEKKTRDQCCKMRNPQDIYSGDLTISEEQSPLQIKNQRKF